MFEKRAVNWGDGDETLREKATANRRKPSTHFLLAIDHVNFFRKNDYRLTGDLITTSSDRIKCK